MTSLKTILIQKNMSQNKLSHLANVPTNMINLICNGRLVPCPAWRKRISETLGVDESILFPEEVITHANENSSPESCRTAKA
jgi:transcriptional regulator with XRE-family HTH domain